MYRYTIVRILLMFPTIIGAGILVFFLMRIIPGDICLTRWVDYGTNLDPSILELCRDQLGLNNPLSEQFMDFLKNIVSLNFGVSMYTGNSMSVELGHRFSLSFQMAIMALVLTTFIGIPLGVLAARKYNTWVDHSIRLISIAGVAVPSFWLGILLLVGILILSQHFFQTPWMPPIVYVSPFEDLFGNLSQLIWPSIAVGLRYICVIVRMTRSSLLEVLSSDYIRTTRAKGISEYKVARKHAFKNAFLPVLTILGSEFAFMIGGLVVTEQVFNLNGLGALLVQSVEDADYITIQNLVMLFAFIFVIVNFIIDIIYSYLDPRIRYR